MDKVNLKIFGYVFGCLSMFILGFYLPPFIINSAGRMTPLYAGAFAFAIFHIIYCYYSAGAYLALSSSLSAISFIIMVPLARYYYSVNDYCNFNIAVDTSVWLVFMSIVIPYALIHEE